MKLIGVYLTWDSIMGSLMCVIDSGSLKADSRLCIHTAQAYRIGESRMKRRTLRAYDNGTDT